VPILPIRARGVRGRTEARFHKAEPWTHGRRGRHDGTLQDKIREGGKGTRTRKPPGFYDRRNDDIGVEEVERIGI
jgi:hypothetical protein